MSNKTMVKAEITRLPQNENKDSMYARAHKLLKEKYGLKWSRGRTGPKQYTGDVKLNTGKTITKAELTVLIKKLLGSDFK